MFGLVVATLDKEKKLPKYICEFRNGRMTKTLTIIKKLIKPSLTSAIVQDLKMNNRQVRKEN